jgi:hypothetical protein
LEIREQIFGEEHYSVATCWLNLAYILEEQEISEEAYKYAWKAKEVFVAEFGASHGYAEASQQILN